MGWHVTANDINQWSNSNTREAQEILPLLIRKLILATAEPDYINMPSGDSILIGGWDGIVKVKKGNPFVPNGKSVWEFGTNRGIKQKAEGDYAKRTEESADLNVTYIFATLKTWAKKDDFEIDKNKEKKWNEVRGVNADDLEVWLTLAPAVHKWFAKKIGKIFPDILEVEEAFNQWAAQTKVNLTEELVLDSREEQVKKLKQNLLGKPGKLIIDYISEMESYVFTIAALKDDIQFSSKVLVIKTQEAWNKIIDTKSNLILIYREFVPDNIGAAIKNGHFVIEFKEFIKDSDKGHEIIRLSKIKRSTFVSNLQKLGFDYDKAWRIYVDTKGFLHVLIRHPLLKPYENIKPKWIDSYSVDVLSTILFLNSWNRKNSSDIAAIEDLSGMPYENFEKDLFKS